MAVHQGDDDGRYPTSPLRYTRYPPEHDISTWGETLSSQGDTTPGPSHLPYPKTQDMPTMPVPKAVVPDVMEYMQGHSPPLYPLNWSTGEQSAPSPIHLSDPEKPDLSSSSPRITHATSQRSSHLIDFHQPKEIMEDKLAFLPSKYTLSVSAESGVPGSSETSPLKNYQKPTVENAPPSPEEPYSGGGTTSGGSNATFSELHNNGTDSLAKEDSHSKRRSGPDTTNRFDKSFQANERPQARSPQPSYQYRRSEEAVTPTPYHYSDYMHSPHESAPNIITVEPPLLDAKGRSHRRTHSRDTLRDRESRSRREKSRDKRHKHRDTSRDHSRDPSVASRKRRDESPQSLVQKMSSLTVDSAHYHPSHRRTGSHGHHSRHGSLTQLPPSPLLESYRGTYQEASPMPSPVFHAQGGSGGEQYDSDYVPPLDLQEDDDRGEVKRRNRRARFYDPQDIALRIAHALTTSDRSEPNIETLIELLPGLTHDQVIELRAEYKSLVKTGPERKGVNVAKHIKVRLKDEDRNLMKACYTVALGQWESEAYWANTWYQKDKTRRELLLEALMGRTNDEIRLIKNGFRDRRYENDLIQCMREELKEDKFKKSILMVLNEERMEDYDQFGKRVPVDMDLVEEDADRLYNALQSSAESTMLSIVVRRSDAHLREVLRSYEGRYHSNFPRTALKRSGNLVGEILAHILNGVINKPVRDAILLHHALTASRRDSMRRELLTSRLVRFHWDQRHMEAVKRAYRERYGRDLQEAIKDATTGNWGLFCQELCIARIPDDIKQVERVNIHGSKRRDD